MADQPTKEIGASGLAMYGGRPADEFHRKLRGDQAVKIYREMQDNDPVVGALLFGVSMLIRQVGWHVEPRDPDCAECAAQVEFLESCLDDMSTSWPQALDAVLSFLPYGWSFLEIVYKIRGGPEESDPKRRSKYSDGLFGWRKLALRGQETRSRWIMDDEGGVQAFVQLPPGTGSEVTIPIERGLLFRTSASRGNPEGRSILRNAYRPWYFKKHIEEVEGIGVERDLAGLPIAGVPPEYLDENASLEQKAVLAEVKNIVQNVRNDEQTGVVFPREIDPDTGQDLWSFSLLSTGGRRAFDTDAIVARYDQRIAMVILADFILLGHENVGSMALGVSKIELFTIALSAWLDSIATVMNEHGVPRLMALNGVAFEHSPLMAHDEVAKVDLDGLGVFLEKYARAGGVLDEELEGYLREQAGWPQPDPEATVT